MLIYAHFQEVSSRCKDWRTKTHVGRSLSRCNEESIEVSFSGITKRGGGNGQTAPGNTLQWGDTRTKKIFVGKFSKNSGQTRSDR